MMRIPALACALLVVLGCASRSPGASAYGLYRFDQSINEAIPPVTLQGTLTIANGLAELDLYNRPCRYHERSTKHHALFDCDDIQISVDVPMSRAHYSIATMVRHPVRVCTAWQAMSTGERRCMNYETRIEERPGKRSGSIRLIRELR